MKHHLLTTISCFLLPSVLCAKPAQVLLGKVFANGQPLAYSNVWVMKPTDSAVISAELTDDNGGYVIPLSANPTSLLLKVFSPGYKDVYVPVSIVSADTNRVQDIMLIPVNKELGEVTVRTQKPFVEVKPDKLVVNVENSIVSTGGTAMDVLMRSPGVKVDQNDNISLKGKQGVTIMINGRIQPISGDELAAYLKSLPADVIAQIELISNPSAKYDAAGTGGIINIKLRKNKKMGMNGSITASYIQGVYDKYTAGASFNYRNDKWNAYVNWSGANREGFSTLKVDRDFYAANDVFSGGYRQDNFYKYYIKSHNLVSGIDYKLNAKTTVGMTFTGEMNGFTRTSDNHSDMLDSATHKPTGQFATVTDAPNQWNNASVNFNLSHQFDSLGRALSVDVDYGYYPGTGTQDILTRYYLYNSYGYLEPNTAKQDAQWAANQNSITQIRSIKMDYTEPLKNDASVEAGFKVSYVTADNDMKFYNVYGSVQVPDVGRTNRFIYNENINAAYINYSKNIKKWSMQLGLRGEQTIADGHEITTDTLFNRNYFQLFPSMATQYHFNDKHDLGVTLSRRIARPSYEQLNPFKYYLDPSFYKTGYPYMNPALTYAMELTHVYKQRLITTLSYSITDQPITEVLQPSDGDKKVIMQSFQNLTTMEYVGLSGSYQFSFYKWWNSMLNFNAYYSNYKGNKAGTPLNTARVSWDVYCQNSFLLPKNWSVEAVGFYQAPSILGYLSVKELWSLDIGIQKNLLDKKLTVKMVANDIFWKSYPRGSSVYNNYKEQFAAIRDTRTLTLSVVYRWGNGSAQRKHQSGAEDEKNRLGQGRA